MDRETWELIVVDPLRKMARLEYGVAAGAILVMLFVKSLAILAAAVATISLGMAMGTGSSVRHLRRIATELLPASGEEV